MLFRERWPLSGPARNPSMPQATSCIRVLLLYVLPFCYGAATRVPFVFASLHVVAHLGCSLPTLAGVLGCYQVFRVLGNYLVGVAGPDVALPLGAAAGLLGYGTMAAATAFAPAAVGPAAVAACLALVGLSEVITALQFFCKTTYSSDPAALRSNLLRLYACNVSGTCFAFLASAWLYHVAGLTGSACLGAGLEAVLLLGSLAYLAIESGQAATPRPSVQAAAKPCARKHAHPFAAAAHLHLPDDTTAAAAQAEAGLGAPPLVLLLSTSLSLHSSQLSTSSSLRLPRASGSLRLPRGSGSLSLSCLEESPFTHIADGIPEEESTELLNGGGGTGVPPLLSPHLTRRASRASSVASNAPAAHGGAAVVQQLEEPGDHAPWVNLVLAYTFAVQAALIGTILSTAPLLLHDALGLGVLHVGVAFAAGELLGSAALLANSTPAGQALARRFVPLPLSLLWVLGAMGVVAVALPVCVRPAAALLSVVAIMGLNDVGTSMTGECQGSSLPERHFARLNTLGNMLRRGGNTVTCALGPLMYSLHPLLPFALFGVLTLCWVGLLAAMLALRARQVDDGHEVVPCRSAKSALTACISVGLQEVGSDLQRYKDQSFVSKERSFWASVDSGGKKGGLMLPTCCG